MTIDSLNFPLNFPLPEERSGCDRCENKGKCFLADQPDYQMIEKIGLYICSRLYLCSKCLPKYQEIKRKIKRERERRNGTL